MKYAKIELTASGNGTILAGIAGKRFRVLTYLACSTVNVLLTWKSGSTALSGPMAVGAYSNIFNGNADSLPIGILGVLETEEGEDLVLSLSGTASVGGHITYQEVTV